MPRVRTIAAVWALGPRSARIRLHVPASLRLLLEGGRRDRLDGESPRRVIRSSASVSLDGLGSRSSACSEPTTPRCCSRGDGDGSTRRHGRKDVPEAYGFPFNAKEGFVVSPETLSDAHPRRPLPVAVATLLSQVGTVTRMGRPLLGGCSQHYTERAQDRFATKSVIADRSESGRAATVPSAR